MPRPSFPTTGLLLAVLVALASPAASSAPADEALARRLFDLASRLAAEGKTEQALTRFQETVAADPRGSYADDALLASARLHYDVFDLADLGRAGPAAIAAAGPLLRQVKEDYRSGDAAPEALFRLALLELDPDNPARDPDEAWADLAAVVSVYPDSPLAERALVVSATLDEELGRHESAFLTWFRTLEGFPDGPFAARSRLGLGRTLLALHRPGTALRELQAARDRAGDNPVVATEALDLLQVASRLAGLTGKNPDDLYRPAGSRGAALEFRQGRDLAVRRGGEVLVADRAANAVIAVRPDGSPGDRVEFPHPEVVALDHRGGLWVAGEGQIATPRGRGELVRGDGKRIERPAVLVTAGNQWAFLLDAGRREVLRLDQEGDVLGPVPLPAGAEPRDLAADPAGGLAVLDGRDSRILLLDPSGKLTGRLGPNGPGWNLARPVALDRDLAGSFYVLDTKARAVLVIRADGTLLARVTSPREGPGAFTKPVALAVDRAGRILIFDAREDRIVVYE